MFFGVVPLVWFGYGSRCVVACNCFLKHMMAALDAAAVKCFFHVTRAGGKSHPFRAYHFCRMGGVDSVVVPCDGSVDVQARGRLGLVL